MLKKKTTIWLVFVISILALPTQFAVAQIQPTFSEDVFKYHLLSENDLKLNFSAQGNKGAFTYNYDIKVPPGRAGFTPSVRLEYVSGTENGSLGVGWKLNTPYIQRRFEKGGLDYSGLFPAGEFIFVSGASSRELVSVGANSEFGGFYEEFRFKFDDGSLLRFFLDQTNSELGPVWRVLSKDHVWSIFGASEDERIFGPPQEAGDRIFRWYIANKIDVNGNSINYQYDHSVNSNGEPLYLTMIEYGAGNCRINFEWCWDCFPSIATIPDNRAGFPLVTTANLTGIQTQVYDKDPGNPGQWTFVRSYCYELAYEISEGTDRALLKSIKQNAAESLDAKGDSLGLKDEPVSLPAVSFTYEDWLLGDTGPSGYHAVSLENSFAALGNYNPTVDLGNNPNLKKYYQADYNGDGCSDILHIIDDSRVSVWLGRPDGTLNVLEPQVMPESLEGNFEYQSSYRYIFKTGDFNGDGMQDVIHINSKFSASIWFSRKDAAGNFAYFDVVPFSGPSPYCDNCGLTLPFALPDDDGSMSLLRGYPIGSVPTRYVFHIADFNGDGKDDYLTFYKQLDSSYGGLCRTTITGSEMQGRFLIYFSNGDGSFLKGEFLFEGSGVWPNYDFSLPVRGGLVDPQCDNYPPNVPVDSQRQYGVIVADVNNDGLPDLIHPKCAEGVLVTFINSGVYSSDPYYANSISFKKIPTQLSSDLLFGGITNSNPIRFQFGDYNGDGILDMLNANDGEVSNVQYDLMFGLNNWEWDPTEPGVLHDQYDVVDGLFGNLVFPEIAENVVSTDIDGDRMTDLVLINQHPYADLREPNVILFRSLGDGRFGVPDSQDEGLENSNVIALSWFIDDLYIDPNFFLVGDFTGDGMTDFLNLHPNQLSETFMITTNRGIPDMMTKISRESDFSGISSTVADIEYMPAASFDNANLPFPLPVVSSVKLYDGFIVGGIGLPEISTTRTYENGVYDRAEDKYLGFGKVVEEEPNSGATETEYYTDLARSGQVSAVQNFENGVLLTETENSWLIEGSEYPVFPYLHTTTSCINGINPLESSATYSYDPVHHGITEIIQSGDNVETVITNIEYIDVFENNNNPNNTWLWRKQLETKTGTVSGELRRSFWMYHSSGLPFFLLEINDDIVVRSTQYTWTPEGNVWTIEKNGQPNIEYEYEPTKMFPSLIRYYDNAGTTWEETVYFDRRFGIEAWRIDKNGIFTSTLPDLFGRAAFKYTKEAGQTVAHERTIFDDHSVPTSIKKRIWVAGTEDFVDTKEYFDLLGRPVQTTSFGDQAEGEPRFSTTLFSYDQSTRSKTEVGPFFCLTDDYYQESSFPPTQREQQFFDHVGRIKQIVNYTNEITETQDFEHDGDLVTMTDPDQKWKNFRFDGMGKIREIGEMSESGSEIVTLIDRNGLGDPIRIVDAENNEYFREFDMLGRLVLENHPDTGTRNFGWTGANKLDFEIEADGHRISNSWDSMGRQTGKYFYRSGEQVTFENGDDPTRNSVGRMTAHQVLNTRWGAAAFHPNGFVTEDTVSINGTGIICVQGYEYDGAGRLKTLRYTDGYEAKYDYFPFSNWICQITAGSGNQELKIIYSNYVAQGIAQKVEYFWGGAVVPAVTIQSTVDVTDGRIHRIVVRNSQSTGNPAYDILHEDYKYTPGGDLREVDDRKLGAQLGLPGDHYIYEYEYDNLHRLTHLYKNGEPQPSKLMVYDDLGRLKENWTGKGKVEFLFGGLRPHAPRFINIGKTQTHVSYDGRGNMVSFPAASYSSKWTSLRTATYNAMNKPSKIRHTIPNLGVFTESFSYNAKGRRVRKTNSDNSTIFYFTNNFEVDEGVAKKYVTNGSQRLAEVTSDGIKIRIVDRMGSIRALCDETGAVVFSSDYDVWGAAENVTGTPPRDRFTGAESDRWSYLLNLKAREYDPVFGCFVAPDNINPDINDPQSLNRFAYARNNPTRFVDPNGHHIRGVLEMNSGGSVQKRYEANHPGEVALIGLGELAVFTGTYGAIISAPTVFSLGQAAYYYSGAKFATLLGPRGMGFFNRLLGVRKAPKTEIVQRAMSRGELNNIVNKGVLSRGGRSGPYYVSDAVNSTANRARLRLALPSQPQVRATLEVPSWTFSSPTRVQPFTLPNGKVLPGGGMERIAPGNLDIPARVINVLEY